MKYIVYSIVGILVVPFILYTAYSIPVYAHQQYTIEMPDGQFVPNHLEINQGDEVVFKNTGSKSRWPASNIHPTHDIYPEFDPKRELLPGESWTFQFNQAGSFRFHDHIYASLTGEIMVRGEKGEVRDEKPDVGSMIDRIKAMGSRIIYLIFPGKLTQDLAQVDMREVTKNDSELGKWLLILDGKRVMDELIVDTGGGTIADCHQESHKVGRKAYKLFGISVFKDGNYGCHSGFYHGAMEIFLSELGTKNLAIEITNLCNKFSSRFGNFECLHGVGHGLLAYLDYDLPATLTKCKELEGSFAQTSCYSGAFMENVVTAQGRGAKEGHETKWVSLDPHFPCNGIDQSYDIQYQCYMMQTSRMLDLYGPDFAKVALECPKARSDMVTACFQSLGRDSAGQTLRDPTGILNTCLKVPGEYFSYCMIGGLNVIIDFWGEDMVNQPHLLCNIVPIQHKEGCYQQIGMRLQDVFPKNSDKQKICNLSDPAYIATCYQAAGI